MFIVENPEAKEVKDYREFLNPDSLSVIENCVIEPSIADQMRIKHFQFEREGYFILDEKLSAQGELVFNRTISLRDSWGK